MSAHVATIESDVGFAGQYDESEAEGSEGLRYSAEDLSAYYYELECLLVQVDMAETHYKILGIDYLSTTGEITTAYLKAMILLEPATYGLEPELPQALGPRVARASERISVAFRTLMDFDERLDYDSRLFGWENESSKQKERRQQGVKTEPKGSKNKRKNVDRRERERFALPLPVAVTGYDEDASDWHEVVESVDLSRSGACILLRKRVIVGNVLYLRMPMPTVLRTHEYLDQTYGTYAIVRWITTPRDGFSLAGIEFIGELPPPGFRQRPWAKFNIGKSGAERREEPRECVSEAIEIEYFDEAEQLIKKDLGFLEDISDSGVRVCSQEPPLDANLIRIIRPKVSLSMFARVRNRFKGRDGYERLCAQFISECSDSDVRSQ